MPLPISGIDGSVYAWHPYGQDGVPADGGVINMIGVWEKFEIEIMNEWTDRTPNNQLVKVKRLTAQDWRGTGTNQIQSNGATGLSMALHYQLIYVIFTEIENGGTIEAWGGISRDRYSQERTTSQDALEFENVGNYVGPGGYSLVYTF